jgi:hypothetical protein
MQKNRLIALFVVTAIVVVAAIGLTLAGGGSAPDRGAGERVAPELASHVGDVATITVARAAGAFNVVRQADGNWGVAEKSNYPADTAKVRQTVLGMAELTLVEPKTAKPDSYPRLEVEDAGKEGAKSALLTLKDKSGGKLAELIVGKRRVDRLGTGVDGVYVRRPGEAQSWLAKGTLELPPDAKDWLDKKVAAIAAKRIKSVTLIQPDSAKVVLQRDNADAKFTVEGAPEGAKVKSDYTVSEPASTLDNLELTDVQPEASLPFPAEGVNQAELVTFDGLTVTVRVLEKDGTNWIRLAASGTGDAEKEAKAFNDKVSPWVYAVAPYKANPLKTKMADLIEQPKSS